MYLRARDQTGRRGQTGAPQTRGRRLIDAAFGRLLKLPPIRGDYTVARDLPVPMRDGAVRIELDPVAHRFTAGNRIRLLVSGGSFPRWERNLGTSEPPGTAVAMAASHQAIGLAGSCVRLPVRA